MRDVGLEDHTTYNHRFAVNEIVWEFYIHLEAMRNPASILKSLGVDGEILKTWNPNRFAYQEHTCK